MTATIAYYPKFKSFLPNSTQVNAGGKVYTYLAGTSTLKTTYTDQAKTTPNANPVVLDANGEADIWLDDDALYKIVVKDSDDVTISGAERDNVGSTVASTSLQGNYNLVNNGSFETDSDGDGEPDEWTLNITSGGTIAVDTADQNHGANSLKFVGSSAGAGTATSAFFEVQASKEIGIRFSLKASAATVYQTVKILWYTAAKAAASTSSTTIYNVTTTAPTSWTEQSLQTTSGSDVKYAKIEISGSANAGTTYYDDVWIGDIVDASETVKGVIELATQTEVDTGTDAVRAVTPDTLASGKIIRPGTSSTEAQRTTNLYAALSSSTGIKISDLSTSTQISVFFTTYYTNTAIAAGGTLSLSATGLWYLDLPAGIALERYNRRTATYVTDPVFDGSVAMTGDIVNILIGPNSHRLKNTTAGSLTAYYGYIYIPML